MPHRHGPYRGLRPRARLLRGPRPDHRGGPLSQGGFHVLSTPLRPRCRRTVYGQGRDDAFLDRDSTRTSILTSPTIESSRITTCSMRTATCRPLSTPDSRELARYDDVGRSPPATARSRTGFYRGIASEANCRSCKARPHGRISDQNIFDGLAWVHENRERFDNPHREYLRGAMIWRAISTNPSSQLVRIARAWDHRRLRCRQRRAPAGPIRSSRPRARRRRSR